MCLQLIAPRKSLDCGKLHPSKSQFDVLLHGTVGSESHSAQPAQFGCGSETGVGKRMLMETLTCRVCGSTDARMLPLGQYAEFFRLWVDTTKDEFELFSRVDSITTRPLSLAARVVRKIRKSFNHPHKVAKVRPPIQFRTYMQACTSCHSITPCHEYSFEDLLGLYHDYR
jgi:hypothetical protein